MVKRSKLVAILASVITLLAVAAVVFVFVILPMIKNDDDGDSDTDKTFLISSVEIQINEITVTNITKEFDSENIQLAVVINSGEDISEYDTPVISWSFVGDALDCQIEDGLLIIGEIIGQTKLRVTVISANEVSSDVLINITSKEGSVLQSIEVTHMPLKTEYISGQIFDRNGLIVIAHYEDYSVQVANYTTSSLITGVSQLEIIYSDGGITKTTMIPVSVTASTLQSIVVRDVPHKTVYIEGEFFDKTGLVIEVIYSDGYGFHAFEGEYTIQNEDAALTPQDTFITIIYTSGPYVKTTTQSITVKPRTLQSISLNTESVIKHYNQGQRFDPTGLVVTANYEYMTRTIDNYEVSNTNKLTHSDTEITISYMENNITKTQVIEITVDLPYSPSSIRTVRLLGTPADVTLTWLYMYTDEDGNDQIDYTSFTEQGLVYDTVNGIFEIPALATITLTAINPNIIDFILNDQLAGMLYPARSFEFVLGASDVDIEYERIIGERITIRFEGLSQLIFQYPLSWNGILRDEHIVQLEFIFDEGNVSYVNKYYVGSTLIGFFEDLKQHPFSADTTVTVVRTDANVDNFAWIVLIYWQGVEVDWQIDLDDPNWFENLPTPYRAGFDFVEWSLVEEGIYEAVWDSRFGDVDYTTENFIGTWTFIENEYFNVTCTYELRADGTFTYTVTDGENFFEANGIYRFEFDEIVVLLVEADDELSVYEEDFVFDITECGNDLLTAVAFIVDGEMLISFEMDFGK